MMNNTLRASEVTFCTREFEFSHGKRPGGYGSWAFVPYAQSRRDNNSAHQVWMTGTYGEAKRAAAKAFAAAGVSDVVVCS